MSVVKQKIRYLKGMVYLVYGTLGQRVSNLGYIDSYYVGSKLDHKRTSEGC